MTLIEGRVVAAVAATAAAKSPQVRKAARSGLVYGLAGALKAGDIAAAAARGMARATEPVQETAPPTGRSTATARQSAGGSKSPRAARSRSGTGGKAPRA